MLWRAWKRTKMNEKCYTNPEEMIGQIHLSDGDWVANCTSIQVSNAGCLGNGFHKQSVWSHPWPVCLVKPLCRHRNCFVFSYTYDLSLTRKWFCKKCSKSLRNASKSCQRPLMMTNSNSTLFSSSQTSVIVTQVSLLHHHPHPSRISPEGCQTTNPFS